MASPLLVATEAGQARLRDRDQALQLAREKPALAREVGVGRPDQPGAFDAGVVDLNNAPASALARLPGVGDDLATRIIEARTQTNGFSSLEDLGILLDSPRRSRRAPPRPRGVPAALRLAHLHQSSAKVPPNDIGAKVIMRPVASRPGRKSRTCGPRQQHDPDHGKDKHRPPPDLGAGSARGGP